MKRNKEMLRRKTMINLYLAGIAPKEEEIQKLHLARKSGGIKSVELPKQGDHSRGRAEPERSSDTEGAPRHVPWHCVNSNELQIILSIVSGETWLCRFPRRT